MQQPDAPASKSNRATAPAVGATDLKQGRKPWLATAPAWLRSMVAGNSREKDRLRHEISQIRGGIRLLMKQRNGGKWSSEDKRELRDILRRLSSVSPYLLIWVLPGSVLILPFLAWHLDARRKRRDAAAATP